MNEHIINYPKRKFNIEEVLNQKKKMDMQRYWKVTEDDKNYKLEFHPTRIKLLKTFQGIETKIPKRYVK